MVDASGHFVTDTYTWVNSGALTTLIAESASTATHINRGLRIGGPGEFDVHAGSIGVLGGKMETCDHPLLFPRSKTVLRTPTIGRVIPKRQSLQAASVG
jgi:hypothetical protein